jgi:hypothetical protein
MKLTIDLSREEYCRFRAKIAMADTTPRDLLAQFIADLTASRRSGGSDERDMAQAWLERSHNMAPDYDAHEAGQDSETRCRRAMRWRKAA